MADALAGVLTPKYSMLNADPDESHMVALAMLGTPRRVLEVGAATGYLSELLASSGIDVVPVEIDPIAANHARARGVPMRLGPVAEVVDKDERFDAILLLDVLEHVGGGSRFLQDCVAHLEPGGVVMLSVPNVAHWTVRWSLARGRFEYSATGLLDETHVRFYTRDTLLRLLSDNGLQVVERRHTLGLHVYSRWRLHSLAWYRRRVIRLLAQWWPGLFAYQFVWKAELVRTPERQRLSA